MKKTKMIELMTIVVLMTLIVTRICLEILSDGTQSTEHWISVVNYMGIPIAVYSLYMQVAGNCNAFTKGLGAIVCCLLIIPGVLIFTQVLTLNSLWNDLILLVTLLISLPTRLYCSLLTKKAK